MGMVVPGCPCSASCTCLPYCGDGVVSAMLGEACDDGNDVDTDACIKCQHAVCGDGFVHAGVEECDAASSEAGPGECTDQCRRPSCADGLRNQVSVAIRTLFLMLRTCSGLTLQIGSGDARDKRCAEPKL